MRLATVTLGSGALTCGAAVTLAVITMLPQGNATYYVRRGVRSVLTRQISLVYQMVRCAARNDLT